MDRGYSSQRQTFKKQRGEESKERAPPKDRERDEKKSKGLGQEPEKQRRRL